MLSKQLKPWAVLGVVAAAALAGCDGSSISVSTTPVDPPVVVGPVLLSDIVIDEITMNTNDTAEPIAINDLDLTINNDADFQPLIDGGSGT